MFPFGVWMHDYSSSASPNGRGNMFLLILNLNLSLWIFYCHMSSIHTLNGLNG
jgi:hypothetical protein